MTLRIARLYDHGRHGSLDVYLDDQRVAHLAKGAAVNVNGTGKSQELIVRASGSGESRPLVITDPGPNQTIGVIVSYIRFRGLFKPTSSLSAELVD